MDEIHPYYQGMRIYYFVTYIPLWLTFSLQLYWDRRELKDLREWKKVARISRLSGWTGCILASIANIDFYGVFGIYPQVFSATVYSLSVCFAYLPLVLAGYNATLAATKFFSDEKRDVLAKITMVLFFNTGPIVMASLIIAIISHYTATGLINCISGLIAYPTLAIGVNVMHYFLRRHYNKMISIKTNRSKAAKSLRRIVHKWRSYAIYISLIMAIVTLAYVLRFMATIGQAARGEVNSTAADATYVGDPSMVPGFGGIALPIAVQLCIVALLWRSWRTKAETVSDRRTMTSSDPISDRNNRGSVPTSATANGGGGTKNESTQAGAGVSRTGTVTATVSMPMGAVVTQELEPVPPSTTTTSASPVSTSASLV